MVVGALGAPTPREQTRQDLGQRAEDKAGVAMAGGPLPLSSSSKNSSRPSGRQQRQEGRMKTMTCPPWMLIPPVQMASPDPVLCPCNFYQRAC